MIKCYVVFVLHDKSFKCVEGDRFVIEYVLGRKKMKTDALVENKWAYNKFFANERPDKEFKGNRLLISQSSFAKMGFRESKFYYSRITHSTFIDCYFKKTVFENCDFTGCKFINCTFDEVIMINCRLDYTAYVGTTIEYNAIYHNLPKNEYNLRHNLCRNLALESLKAGKPDEYRKFYFEEKRSSEKHYWEMIRQNQDWYRGHYSTWDRIIGLGHLLSSLFNKVLWGYGEKLTHLIGVMLTVMLAFTLIYWNMGSIFKVENLKEYTNLRLIESLYLSVSNFFTVTPNIQSQNVSYNWLASIEGAIGIILVGFFSAALFRNINRR